MKRQKYQPMGSVISGTMRPEDLIPAFVHELEYCIYQNGGSLKQKQCSEIRQIIRRMASDNYYESNEADYDMEYLYDCLNEFAPPYFYFGAHPNDGADYGFWLDESLTYEFGGLQVNDLREVPKGYCGEVLKINDQGDMTLYYRSPHGKLRKIWAIV